MELTVCPHCRVRVLPMEGGVCPSCQGNVNGAPAAPKGGGAMGGGQAVAKGCPRCGNEGYREIAAVALIAMYRDRVCSACGCVYRRATPVWAAVAFVVLGLVLFGFMAISILARLLSPGIALLGLALDIPLLLLGLAAVIFGIKELLRVPPANAK